MKIAFITSHIYQSSQWKWFHEELKENEQFNAIHIVIDERTNLPLVNDLLTLGVKTYFLYHKSKLSHLINLFKVIRLLKNHNSEVVHTSLPFGNLIGLLAAFLLNIKKRVTTCESASWSIDHKHTKQKLIDKLTYRLAKKVIVTTTNSQQFLKDKWKLHDECISFIPQAIKLEEFENISNDRIEKVRREFNLTTSTFIIGMVARAEFWKGHKYAIEAMKNLTSIDSKIQLHIFGSEGPEHNHLQHLINENMLENNVFLHGFASDIHALYKTFNVHLHVPINEYSETYGLTVIEGMASQVPQVLTKSGCVQDVHTQNSALLIPFENSDSIQNAILQIQSDDDLKNSLTQHSIKQVKRLLSLQNKLKLHVTLYYNL